MLRSLLVILLLSLRAVPALAAVHITDPWPDPESLSDTREEAVSFPSSDPFTPADLGHGPARTTHATLYLPADAAPGHPVPAVVMLHGAAGLVAERGATYGPQLAAMGGGDAGRGHVWLAQRSGGRVYPAHAAHHREHVRRGCLCRLRYLATRPEIDAHHVVLTGFSYGGMATMYALYAEMADRLVPPSLRFAGHVSFYGPCIAPVR